MSKKGRSTSTGMYSGANLPDLKKRLSYKGFGKTTGASKVLTFFGLARGNEYTPLTGAGRIIIIHGIGTMVVDDKVQFEASYVAARFKALRFARELKLGVFYEFTDFLYETWDPKIITPATQDKLHSLMFADYNVANDKCKELDGPGPFVGDPRLIFTTIGQIHTFFEGADPSLFGKEKPVLCCRFKTISATGDSMVANGMIRSVWRVGDAHDSIAYSAIGDSRTRFSLEVGKEYKVYGFSVYYNGNSPPILQPTMWGHLEECSQDAEFADIQTIDNEDQVEKFFVFTMIKFAAIAMTCPAHDCQSLVDAGTLSILLICPHCGASFRLDNKKLQIKMILNGIETAPMIDKQGCASAISGPTIENFRIAEYAVVQKLFAVPRPEKLLSKPNKLHRASANAMARLFKVTYHRESLVISNLEESEQKLADDIEEDSEDSTDDDSDTATPRKREAADVKRHSEASSAEKKKRKHKTSAKKPSQTKKPKASRRLSTSSSEASRHKTKKKKTRRISSSSSDSNRSGSSNVASDDSSTASLTTRSKQRRQRDKDEEEAKELENQRNQQEEQEEKDRREQAEMKAEEERRRHEKETEDLKTAEEKKNEERDRLEKEKQKESNKETEKNGQPDDVETHED